MSATEAEPAVDEEHDSEQAAADEHADAHPTPKQYVQVAVVLAVLTAMEVSASYIDVGAAFMPLLIILMSIKFVLVAGWFMHLRFDTTIYARFMGAGLSLAATIYAVVLFNFYLHG